MFRRFVLAAAVLMLALAGLRADAAAVGIARTPDFVTKVNNAIDRGATWIKANQQSNGSFGEYGGYPYGLDSLVYHTLRVCGVRKDDPVAVRAWDNLARQWDRSGRGALQTYTAGLLLMAIAEHGERIADPRSDREVTLDAKDRAWAEDVARWLVRAQTSDGTWSYGASDDGPYGRKNSRSFDHSNTQYALLGLKAAARCGITIDGKVWRASLQHFLDAQEKAGPEVIRFDPDGSKKGATSAGVGRDHARGWGYVGQDAAYGSMTAGGVGSLVICRSELLDTPAMTKALEAQSEAAMRDGLSWLGRNFTVRTNPGPPSSMAGSGWHYYYLYAVERAGVLSATEWMVDHDWYGEGADYLCGEQSSEGGWMATGMEFIGPRGRKDRAPLRVVASPQSFLDTCFALLFLKKGTIPVRRGALTQAADDTDIRFDAAAALTGKDFGDFIDLILLRWRRSTDEDVQKRLFDGATSVGPKIVEPLLMRMDSNDAESRAAAHALLRHATGQDHGFDPRADSVRREETLVKWQAWWLGASKSLTYDAAVRKLVVR
ncbi:MAG: terpene cyclase/mutase family protein [Planctomycetes bacterium]|nr:terpene cyclase/mutase family protein [Planctomycetota bacterium]